MTEIGKNHLSQFIKPNDPPAPVIPVEVITEDPAVVPEVIADTPIEGADPIIEDETLQSGLSEESVMEFLKQRSNGRAFETIDELFVVGEPKDNNTLDKYSDKVKGFLKYHEDTGRDYDDYKSLSTDFTKKSALELAREKAIEISGGRLEKDEVDAYLEHKLNIDLSDEESIEKFDLIELDGYVKDFRENKIKEQEKYLKPLEDNNNNKEDFVTLDNGTIVPKTMYEDLGNKRQDYIENLNKSSDNIKGYELKLKIDDNGEVKTYDLDYEYSKDDKHSMLSRALDIDKSIEGLFGSEEGFNHGGFAESFFWIDPKNREKAIGAIVNKALAKQAEDILSAEHNVNFKNPRMPQGGNQKRVPVVGQNNYGVKYEF